MANLLRCLVGDKPSNWDLVLAQEEFAYNSSVNRITKRTPFEIVTRFHPKGTIELRYFPTETRRSVEAEDFIVFMRTLHDEVKKNLEDNNLKYK